MKELDSFTVERLEDFICQPLENGLTRGEQMALARIALSAKQAEPVSFIYTGEGGYYGYAFVDTNEAEIHIKDDQKLYLFPPLSQTNQSELSDSVNEFLKSLDDYKDQLVPINRNSALVNDLRKALYTTSQLNSPEIPEGWKLVPIAPTRQMMAQGHFAMGGTDRGKFMRIYQAMLNAAPEKPL